MITKLQVQSFLEQFHTKMKIFGILYRDDRGKNQKALEELEIVPSYRTLIIESLKVDDYIQGPIIDELNKLGEMWVQSIRCHINLNRKEPNYEKSIYR